MSTNFENLIGYGSSGSKPSAGVPGRLYYDTTLSEMERDNGSSWDVVEGGGGGGGGTPTDGWNVPSETWTYASASTFTVPTNLTGRFVKGTRLRWKQGGAYKYGTVISSSYGSPNTTVTIVVNTDFVIANSSITDVGWSYFAVPLDYPTWFNFASVVTAAAGTITSYTVNTARYAIMGNLVHLYLDITITNVGTGNGGMICTAPFTFINNNQGCGRETAAAGWMTQAFVSASDSTIFIFKYDVTTVLATGYRPVVSITAEI